MEGPGEEVGREGERGRLYLPERLRRAARWLRDLHRGYAYTGHLPRRRD